jgi:hypothetical protein
MTGCFLLALAATLAGPALDQPGSSASKQPLQACLEAGAILWDDVLTIDFVIGRLKPERLPMLRDLPARIEIV